MKILDRPQPFGSAPDPVVLAIGVFDGVHLGHAEVIRQTLGDARAAGGRAVVVTFDRHPNAVVAPQRQPLMLYPLWRRLEVIASLGVEAALVFAFDLEFSRQPAEMFVDRLIAGFGKVAGICVGSGFVFGHGRSGEVNLLRRLGAERGFAVRGIEPLTLEGEVISSTRLRELVAAGDLQRATACLGRSYGVAGEVVRGDQLGRRLGFPTANLSVDGLVLPPLGVYAGFACGEGLRAPAAINIGRRPTVERTAGEVRVEAHLPGYTGDLYGRRLHVELHERIRGEERFPSVETLRERIGRDVDQVRIWARNKGLL